MTKAKAKLALIPPFSLLDEVSGEYYMYLPQLMKSPAYADFVKRTNTEKAYTMLDNGAFEGMKTSATKLVELAIRMNVNEVVIPDVLHDAEGTIKALEEFHHETLQLRITSAVGLKYMAVPQGRTIIECMDCLEEFAKYHFVTTVGLPKHLVRTVTRTARVQLASYIRTKWGSRFEIHLLGGSPIWPQEIRSARRYDVRGMDTSLPYFYAYYNTRIGRAMREERPEAYFVRTREEFNLDLLYENVHALWGWCSD